MQLVVDATMIDCFRAVTYGVPVLYLWIVLQEVILHSRRPLRHPVRLQPSNEQGKGPIKKNLFR